MWLIFSSEAEAEEAQAKIWRALGKPDETRDGEAVAERITTRWAVPIVCAEGWAIPQPDSYAGDVGGAAMAAPTFPSVWEFI